MEITTQAYEERRTLRRPLDGRLFAGVAAGLADYLDLDVVLVRIGFAALAVIGGLAVPVYLAAWLLIPAVGSDESVAEHFLDHARGGISGAWSTGSAYGAGRCQGTGHYQGGGQYQEGSDVAAS